MSTPAITDDTDYEPRIAPCSNCKDNYWLEDLIWADSGGLRWLCQDCFNAEEGESNDETYDTLEEKYAD